MTTKAIFLVVATTAMFFAGGTCNAADLPKCNDPEAFQIMTDIAKQQLRTLYTGPLAEAQVAMNLMLSGKLSNNTTDQEVKRKTAEIVQKIDTVDFTYTNARVDADTGSVKYCSADYAVVNMFTDAVVTGVTKYSMQMTEDNKLYVKELN